MWFCLFSKSLYLFFGAEKIKKRLMFASAFCPQAASARTSTRLLFRKRETGKAALIRLCFYLCLMHVSGLHAAAVFSPTFLSLFPQIEFAQRKVAARFVNGSVADAFLYLFSSALSLGSIQFTIVGSGRFLLFSSFGTKMLLNSVISFQVSLVKCLMLLAIASVHLALSTVEWKGNACEQADLQFCTRANASIALILWNGSFCNGFIHCKQCWQSRTEGFEKRC